MRYIRKFNEDVEIIEDVLNDIKEFYYILEDEGIEVIVYNRHKYLIFEFKRTMFGNNDSKYRSIVTAYNLKDILVYLEEFFDRVKDVAEKYNIVTKMGTSKGQTGPPGLSIIIGNFPESTMSHLIYNEIET